MVWTLYIVVDTVTHSLSAFPLLGYQGAAFLIELFAGLGTSWFALCLLAVIPPSCDSASGSPGGRDILNLHAPSRS
jgi:hypothetical protein